VQTFSVAQLIDNHLRLGTGANSGSRVNSDGNWVDVNFDEELQGVIGYYRFNA